MQAGQEQKSDAVAFVHIDLGVGGAERFIIDSAVQVQELGHPVTIFTSRFHPARFAPHLIANCCEGCSSCPYDVTMPNAMMKSVMV
jgi:hypothetical protein